MPVFQFAGFTLDPDKGELRHGDTPVEIEPQVFRLLLHLVQSEGRLVSRDELLEAVWHGRVVSDSAISSRIKLLRKALGDNGREQRILRTVPRRGFRFVAEVLRDRGEPLAAQPRAASLLDTPKDVSAPDRVPLPRAEAGRPSIAVLPLALQNNDTQTAVAASAIPDELITELARLRWLFVIARGSSFRFRSFESDHQDVRRELGVRYCLSGAISVLGRQLSLSVELADLESGEVVWSEHYSGITSRFSDFRREIANGVVAALELEIPHHEATRARLVDPEALSTWESYHLGLQHLNLFTATDLRVACGHLERAIALEPGFARAHAALSAAHFQIAFQHLTAQERAAMLLARKHAEESIRLDPQDPFANFVMGRVHWLEDDVRSSQGWLKRATSLSPNSAKGHYAHAWSDAILGSYLDADQQAALALELSPLDPFRYGMLGVRAFSLLGQGDFARAARWANEAAAAPGAHALIALIAVAANELIERHEEARAWAAQARQRHPGIDRSAFFKAFPFVDEGLHGRLDHSLRTHGF